MTAGYCDYCKKEIDCGLLGLNRPINTVILDIFLNRKVKYGKHRINEMWLLFCNKDHCEKWFIKKIRGL